MADLETAAHAADREFLVAEAVDAVDGTVPGTYVDVVTHERHGHPTENLYDRPPSGTPATALIPKGRCECDGYVTRVQVGYAGDPAPTVE